MKFDKKPILLLTLALLVVLIIVFTSGPSRTNALSSLPDNKPHATLRAPSIPITQPVVQASKQKRPNRFPNATVLEQRDSAPDVQGRFIRSQLLKTSFQYPLLRVEQIVETDAKTHDEAILQQREMAADHVMVELVPGKTEADLTQAISTIGGNILRKLHLSYSDTYLVALPHPTLNTVPEAVETFSQFKDVFTFAEPDFVAHKTSTPDDPQLSAQWHLENTGQTGGNTDADIDAPEAWSIQNVATNIIIAVSDTGIDYNHSDLNANMWTNPNEVDNGQDDDGDGLVDDIRGWNFARTNNVPLDDEGHGTFVAGVIGAEGNNGIGIAGVAWHCQLMPVKVLDNTGAGFLSSIAEGFDYARIHGASIINASHAGPGSKAILNAVSNLQTSGILLIAAADNEARNEDTWKNYPAAYTNDNVISVSASDKYDHIAYFANYGPTTIDLFAPGDDIWSTQKGNGYGLDSGTSFATPQVAAVAGLLWAKNPGWTADQVKQAILRSVDLNPLMIGKCVTGGRLNAYRALAGIYNNGPGTIDLSFDPKWTVKGSVLNIAVQSDGKPILVGAFTNTISHNIARLATNGLVDTTFKTGTGANGPVYAVALQPDGKILIGGAFTKFSGVARNRIARLNTNGTLDTTFNPGTGADGNVNAILIQPNGKIVLGGAFNHISGQSRANLARLNLNGSVDPTFTPPAVGLVQALALQSDGKILFGGNAVGRVNVNGSADGSFSAGNGVNGLVRTIAVDGGGLIVIGGDFTSYNNVAQGHIARLLSNGTLDDTFATGSGASDTSATVKSIVFEDDCTLLAVGTFTNFNTFERAGLVKLDASGAVDQNFDSSSTRFPGANAIALLNDGRAYLGGAFTNYTAFPRRYVARIIGRELALGVNSFEVSTNNLNVSAVGGTQIIAVTTLGCAPWKTFTGSNDWVTVTSGAIGFGSGNAILSIAANTNNFPRTTILSIAGNAITLTQAAALVPSAFSGRTLLMNERLFVTFPSSNTFVSRIFTEETFGTFVYTIINPTNASLAINDSFGAATIYLYFNTPTSGTYTNTRGSFGVFTLYPTRPDFDGDGRSDLLWVHSTNAVRAWFMSGTNFLASNRLAAGKKQPTSWKLVTANDFNFDGQSDLLWQNSLGSLSVWLMNKTNYLRTVALGSSGGYKVIGTSDVNFDGKKDLVFQTGTGYLLAWLMNGTNRLAQVKLNRNKPVPVSLKPVGLDDFDHNGQPDLLWQGTNNVLTVWTMSGTNFTSTNVLNGGVAIENGWRAVAINDLNYDSNPDILFGNTAGELWVWLLSGYDVIDSFWLQPSEAVDPKWRIAGPK